MKEELFQELLQSVREMKSIRSGKAKPSRAFTVDVPAEVAARHPKLLLVRRLFGTMHFPFTHSLLIPHDL